MGASGSRRRPIFPRRGAILAAVAFSGVLATAAPGDGPGATADVEVSLVVVDVVVTDEDGEHIEGLRAEDFELSEDGERQEITDFTEEGAPGQPLEAAGAVSQRVVLFMDESRMSPADLARACGIARDFVAHDLPSETEVAVLRYGLALRLVQDFTRDAAKLGEALRCEGFRGEQSLARFPGDRSIDASPAEGLVGGRFEPFLPDDDPERRFRSEDIRQPAPSHARSQELRASERFCEALGLVGKTLASSPGRKSLVLFSPGTTALASTSFAHAAYREMVQSLARANVAVYPVDVASSAADVDARSEMSYVTGMTAGGSARASARERRSMLAVLAADTGGEAATDASASAKLRRAADAVSHYYMLGYVPVDPGKRGFRSLEVRTRVPGARVIARKGYVRDEPYAEMSARERAHQLEEALESWVEIPDLPVMLHTEFYPTSKLRTRVALELHLQGGILAAGADGAGQAELLVHVARPNGRKVRQERRLLTVPAGELPLDLRYLEAFDLKPGTYLVKVVLRDNVRGTLGTAHGRFGIPAFDETGPVMSTLVLLSPRTPARLVMAEGAAAIDLGHHAGGQALETVADHVFPPEGEMVCHFRLGNLAASDLSSQPRVVVTYTVTSGERVVSDHVVHYRLDELPRSELGIPIHVRVPTGQLAPGDYRLEVMAYDVAATKAVRSEVAFTVAPRG